MERPRPYSLANLTQCQLHRQDRRNRLMRSTSCWGWYGWSSGPSSQRSPAIFAVRSAECYHFDIRSDFPGLCRKLKPGLIPQSYVCHQNLDILMGQSSDCLCGIARFDDPVSAVPEILTNCRALERIGIDQEDRFGCWCLSHRCCLPEEIARLGRPTQAFAETGQTDIGHHRMVDAART